MPAHGLWLGELAEAFFLVWVTAWGAEANRRLGPLLDLPQFPVIPLPPAPFPPGAKLPAVAEFAGERPLAWLDDVVTSEMVAWAAARPAPTLLIPVDPAQGLTREVVDICLTWSATR